MEKLQQRLLDEDDSSFAECMPRYLIHRVIYSQSGIVVISTSVLQACRRHDADAIHAADALELQT